MSLISKIDLNNFKSIYQASLEFKPLTFFTGLNSSGKSSLIQFICMAQKLSQNKDISEFGSYEDLRCRYSEKDKHLSGEIYFNHTSKASSASKVFYNNNELVSDTKGQHDWHLIFISANRFGPLVSMSTPSGFITNVGERGENVVPYCILKQDEGVLFTKDPRLHKNADADTFDLNLDAWMSEISPGLKIHTTWDKSIDTSYFKVGNKNDPTIKERPTNVGFGISYTLPVVAQLLGAKSGDIVCIENPEAHLHPQGQTSLGTLISLTANSGVQVIIETHSDHLIDGMRIAVKNNLISPNDVAVYYCSKNTDNLTEYKQLSVTPSGDMSDWPKGFCDQSIKNLTKLARF